MKALSIATLAAPSWGVFIGLAWAVWKHF